MVTDRAFGSGWSSAAVNAAADSLGKLREGDPPGAGERYGAATRSSATSSQGK